MPTYKGLKSEQKILVDKFNRSTSKENKKLLMAEIQNIEEQLEKLK